MDDNILTTKPTQKKKKTTATDLYNTELETSSVLNTVFQGINGDDTKKTINNPKEMAASIKNDELTYTRAFSIFPLASSSDNLLRNPLPNPISKNANQATIEEIVIQIPYSIFPI